MPTARLRVIIAGLSSCITLTLLFVALKTFDKRPLTEWFPHGQNGSNAGKPSVQSKFELHMNHTVPLHPLILKNETDGWTFDWRRDSFKYNLDDHQCNVAFPGLFQDIGRAVERRRGRNITLEDMDADLKGNGTIRAMIFDGQLYIIAAIDVWAPQYQSRALATLQSLYRAIVTSPDPRQLPNIEFALTINDSAEEGYGDSTTNDSAKEGYENSISRPIWAFTRRAEQTDVWIMPDFGFWSFPELHIGTQTEVVRRIQEVEEEVPYSKKIRKLVWRGALATRPTLRGDLLAAAESKSWADVRPIVWDDPNSIEHDLMPIEDHCKYLFVAYTEGRTWSGRLKYLQNCHSVIIAHKMEWIQPANYLLRASGPDQNFVEVERDFSDLENAMTYLLEHPEEVRRIADNSIQTFKQRYITPAAEACYWRKLICGWSKVSFEPEFYKVDGLTGKRKWRGVPFESFALMKDLEWK